MENRQPLSPDHNAVASKDKRLSPHSADPEGGAQDARRFPIEQDASRKIPTAPAYRVSSDRESHFLLVTFLCGRKEK
jgi:hypothetical protein